MCVFRGSSTGLGINSDTNPRLKIIGINHPAIDAGITKIIARPRIKNYVMDTITMPITVSDWLSPFEQSKYKYIINIPGHTAAYRLSYELGMGSVVMMIKSEYKLWYMDKLVKYDKTNARFAHYIEINDDICDWVDYCLKHDDDCRQIAMNAKSFYDNE